MKKLLLLTIFLVACQIPIGEESVDCSPDSTYPISTQQSWETLQYDLPWCWSASDNISNLQLEDGDSDAFLRLTFSSEEMEDPTLAQQEKILEDGSTLYMIFRVEDFESSELNLILDSIKKVKEDLGFVNISSGSCAAPDTTYPISTNQEWQGVEFALPWCWSATDTTDSSDQATLLLEQGEGEAWAKLTLGFGTYDGPSPGYMRSDHDTYSTFDFEGYLYLETNQPDHSDVQMIINSLTLP